jgi:hypothetical protein
MPNPEWPNYDPREFPGQHDPDAWKNPAPFANWADWPIESAGPEFWMFVQMVDQPFERRFFP